MMIVKSWKEIQADMPPETPGEQAAYGEGRREVVAEVVAENLAQVRKMRGG